MLKSLLFSAMTMGVTMSFAQSIHGRVESASDQTPLPGATVRVQETNRYAVADDNGHFEIADVGTGPFVLVTRHVGFSTKQDTVAAGDAEIVITMAETSVYTDEVVVTATRANEKTPTAFTSISKEEIKKQNYGQDLPFLLNWTPSVVTTSDAGTGIGYTGVRIRGSDGTRINVTINGIPYNDSESLGTYWVDVPDVASSTQSIQIQRGVGTSTNGGGAFGASINLQTNTRNDLPYATIQSSAGSFSTSRNTLSFGTGLLKDHWIIDGRLSKINSDGYIDRASADLQSYYLAAGYYAGKTMIKAIMFGGKERTYQSWYGVPESRLNNDVEAMLTTAANEGWNEEQTNNLLNSDSRTFNPYTYKNQVDDYQQDHYQLHFSTRLAESLTANAALHYTYGRGFYEEYRIDDDIAAYGLDPVVVDDDNNPADNDTIYSTDLIRRRWLNNDFYGFTFSLQYDKKNLNVIFGGGWNRYDGDHYGEILWSATTIAEYEHQYYFNVGDKRDGNVYLKANYQLTSRLNLFGDLQVRRVSYKTNGLENKQNQIDIAADFTFFNPKAGLTFDLSDSQQLYGSFAVANREPVRDDFVDNPGSSPKHEQLFDFEAGYRLTRRNAKLHINAYYMDYRNQLVLTGALNDVGASVRTNVDKSYRMGLEIDGAVALGQRWQLGGNVTFSQNKIKSFTETLYDYGAGWDEYNVIERTFKDTDISFSPSVIAGASLTYNPFPGFDVTLLGKYVGKQFLDNTSNDNRSIDPYFINDLRFTYAIHPRFVKTITFQFLVNNVFDELYESNGYTWGYLGGGDEYRENYFYPQAGTNFLGMLTIDF